jgi:bifunctional non-homologous end joining protein LigD
VAEPDGSGGLRICGSVGTGFTDAVLDDLTKRFALIRTDGPSDLLPGAAKALQNITWVRPELKALVAYQERTSSNSLRGPAAYQGLAND